MTKLNRIAGAIRGQRWVLCGSPGSHGTAWTGMDAYPKSGKQVRIAREGGDGEDISAYRFTDRDHMVLECKASFGHAVPDAAIVAFVKALLKGD